MEIPITISVKENTREFAENLFGLGEKITDPEIVKMLGSDVRAVNKSVQINDNVISGQPSEYKFKKSIESVQPEIWFDWDLALHIADKALTIASGSITIADWLWSHIKTKQFKVKINGKEVIDKNDFQKTLDEYLKSKSDNQ